MDTKLRCLKHPKYKALMSPRADCDPCRQMYADAQQNRA